VQVLGDLPGRQPQGRALENSEPPDRCDALAARVVGEKERDMRAERDEERATFTFTFTLICHLGFSRTPPHPTPRGVRTYDNHCMTFSVCRKRNEDS